MSEIVSGAAEAPAKEIKHLVFSVAGNSYAINIVNIFDIIQYQDMTAVPGLPDYVPGIFNLRGTIIPAMDVRLRINQPPGEYDDRTIIIVVKLHDHDIGLIVDAVQEVANFPDEELVAPPNRNDDDDTQYVNAIARKDNKSVLVLDCVKLIGLAASIDPNADASVFH